MGVTKAALYYTDNRLDGTPIGETCKWQLVKATGNMELISVSLKPMAFGSNIVLDAHRGYTTMFTQILTGLEATKADVVFLTEHDVLYWDEHFQFTPNAVNMIYYNLNVWNLRTPDGHAVYYTAKRTSQLCAYREVLVEHYRKRLERIEREGFSYKSGFEPGSCRSKSHRIDDLRSEWWVSEVPNIDIRHSKNLTPSRWSQDAFRDKSTCQNWRESNRIPFWGLTEGRFNEFLEEIAHA